MRRRFLGARAPLFATLTVLGLALAGCSGDQAAPRPEPSGETIPTKNGSATPYGEGAEQVWVLTPSEREVESVVVYLHGYGASLPFDWHLEWMDRLLDRGSAVLFPRYQDGSTDDAWILTPYDLEVGLRTGFAALGHDDEPVVTAGFSLGATLALVYAGRAAEWDVPAPSAVYAIFPVDPILVDLALDLSTVPDTTRVIVVAGQDDDIAGVEAARTAYGLLDGLPQSQKELRVIRPRGELVAYHDAPTLANRPIIRRTYWDPLDRLVDESRAD